MWQVEPYIYKPKKRAPVLSPPAVVAGLGRCGTTLLSNVIDQSRVNYYHTNMYLAYRAYRISAKCMQVANDYIEKRRGTKERVAVGEGKHKDTILLPSFGRIVRSAKPRYHSKTHSYPFPDRPLPSNIRIIWMFGNPMMIAVFLSSKLVHKAAEWKIFMRAHNANMEIPFRKYHDDVLTRDTYMLERHFDA